MISKSFVLLACIGVALSRPEVVRAQGGYSVIVNAANPSASMSAADVAKLFLRKQAKWASGHPVQPVDLVEASPTRKAFSRTVLGMDVPSVKSYWQEMVFSGKAEPPAEKASDADVVAFVKSNAGAIGYVAAGAGVSEVKILSVTP